MKITYRRPRFTVTFTDENGYFSLTGDCQGASGAVGDQVACIDSNFAPLNLVHLANAETGEPMHGFSNVDYFIEQGELGKAQSYMRCGQELFDTYVEAYRAERDNRPTAQTNCRLVEGAHLEALNRLKAVGDRIRKLWKQQATIARACADTLPRNPAGGYHAPAPDEFDDFDNPGKALALARLIDSAPDEIEEDGDLFTAYGREYLVLNDDEADEAQEAELDNYLEECVLPELQGSLAAYFDTERWKEDAKQDGRGHSLGRYDGEEHEIEVDGDTFYIYRQ